MRTKTLILAAVAALGVGIYTSQAAVTSANIVGYANIVLPGGVQNFSALTVPLQGTTNTVDGLITAIQPGDTVYIWTGTGYYNSTYYGPGNDPTYNWFDQYNNWTNPPVVVPGQGFFYLNNQGVNETNTFVGTVILTNHIVLTGSPAYSAVGSTPPIGGLLDSTNFNLPLQPGDTVYVWRGTSYYSSTYYGPGNDPTYNWFDQYNNWTNAPSVSVGEGFFYLNNQGADESWDQHLTVQ